MRITYEFPRNPSGAFQVLHMVGLYGEEPAGYVPMLWETAQLSRPGEHFVQFNYIIRKNPSGLNRPPVLSLAEIGDLLQLYEKKTGQSLPFKFVPTTSLLIPK